MTRTSLRSVVLALAASGVVLAQQTAPDQTSQDPPRDAYGQVQQPSSNYNQAPPAAQPSRPAYGLPNQVILKQGTLVTMRINQKLADNKNAVGDTFSGPLTQPLVIDGIVVAQRGQMVFGKVLKAEKVKGVHFLGIQLTSVALVDGSQAAVQTQLVARQSTYLPYGSKERGAVNANAPGVPGSLVTKDHDSEIYPGTLLTFQSTTNVAINTSNASAFRYVSPDDYSRPGMTTTVAQPRPAYGYAAGPYPYWGYPYPYWGPVVGFGYGFGGYWGGWRGVRFR
jgi:hypothetical protein